ncbi:MAG: hypothetical protein LBH40_05160 [Alphaproteobacteria bacterium]|jgi:hypothetical protein|nr:hypothetical protein [Alphaproteobacteria bacterium]
MIYYPKPLKYLAIFFITLTLGVNFAYADDKKEENERSQIAMMIFNKYQMVAKELGNLSFKIEGRDSTKMIVSSSGIAYKIRYNPTNFLDITIDFDKEAQQITSVSMQSRRLDSPEKIEFYRNNFLILSRLVDNKININEFNNIYTILDLSKVQSEPKFIKSYIHNGYWYNIDAYSRKSSLFTVRIRKSNKTDVEEINLTKDINNMYNETLAKIGGNPQVIYPEISRGSTKTRNMLFYTSQAISMNLLVETGFINHTVLSGNIVYENPIASKNKLEDFQQSALVLILLTNPKLNVDKATEILNNLGLEDALGNKNHYKVFATATNVYMLNYVNGLLNLSSEPRTADYDRKARVEALTQKLYNSIITEFQLDGQVKPITPQNLSTYLLNKQNVVVFRPAPSVLFRIYFDDTNDKVIRANIVVPKVAVDKNLDIQRNNALIAVRMLNPNISKSDAEDIFNYLKNAYGAVETRVIGDFRYKRCTYKDETLVFSRYDATSTDSNDNNSSSNSNASNMAYNPNLVYEPESIDDTGRPIISKPQPLCS